MRAAAREEVRRGRVGGDGGTPQREMKKARQTALSEARRAQVRETARQERSARRAALLAWAWFASAANTAGAGARGSGRVGERRRLRMCSESSGGRRVRISVDG
jgi:hypothetical protein